MKTVKFPDMGNPPIKNIFQEPNKNIHKNSPVGQKPFIYVGVGSRNSGKTTTAVNLVKNITKQKPHKVFNKIYCVSPTFYLQSTLNSLDIDEENISTDVDEINDILDIILDNHIEDNLKRERYDMLMKLKKMKQKGKYDFSNIDDDLLEEIVATWSMGGETIDDVLKNIEKPPKQRLNQLLILDDCYGFLKDNKKFENITIKHRHYNLSIIIILQYWKGVSPLLRSNLSFFVLPRIANKNQLKEIYEQLFSNMTPEKFNKCYEYATKDKYGCLTINMETGEMRKNLNEKLLYS